jgi:hypothetical protein
MPRELATILADLDPTPYEYATWVEQVDIVHLLQELFDTGCPERGIDTLFQIFECFPKEDGYGAFWSVLHALERIPGFEHALLASIRRQPSLFAVTMLKRLLNAGTVDVDGVQLTQLLEDVSANATTPPEVCQDVERFLQRHQQ